MEQKKITFFNDRWTEKDTRLTEVILIVVFTLRTDVRFPESLFHSAKTYWLAFTQKTKEFSYGVFRSNMPTAWENLSKVPFFERLIDALTLVPLKPHKLNHALSMLCNPFQRRWFSSQSGWTVWSYIEKQTEEDVILKALIIGTLSSPPISFVVIRPLGSFINFVITVLWLYSFLGNCFEI